MTTTEMSARQLCHHDEELAKIGEEWSRSDTSAAATGGRGKAPWLVSTLAEEALRIAQEEVERLLCEGQAVAGQGCRALPPLEGPL